MKGGSTKGGGGSSGGGSGEPGSGSGTGGGGGGVSAASGPPVAVSSSYGVAADSRLSVGGSGVLANDRGSGLSAVLISDVQDGTLRLGSDGTFTYTPNTGFVGTDEFTYKAVDRYFNSSSPATVSINVTPIVDGASYSTSSGTPLAVSAPGLLAGAVGSGLSVSVVSGASHGNLAMQSDGAFTYTATPGYVGSDSFSYEATDAAGGVSNVAAVTINVGAPSPPEVTAQTFSGEIANTALQVGGTRGEGPEVFLASQTALSGDTDPGGGTLTTSAGVIVTANGGSVTMASNGTFTYDPPAGFEGPSDSFSYTVDSSDGESSQASATIDFASGRVWYVDSAAGVEGSGTSASPFETLSSASAAAGSGDVIFLMSSGTSYAGGIALGADETLDGASAGLVVRGETLFAASGSTPTITSGSGAGITLADGDTVAGVEVAGTSGAGIVANDVGSFTLAASVSVSDAGGDGLNISGGSGTITAACAIGGSAGHSVAIAGRTGGTVTLSGTIDDEGDGVSLTNDTGATISFTGTVDASTATEPAFVATGGGTVEMSGATSTLATTTATALDIAGGTTIGSGGFALQSISASGGQAIVLDGTGASGAFAVTGSGGGADSGGVIEDSTAIGASTGALSFTDTGSVALANIEIENSEGNAIYADDVASLTLTDSAITDSAANGLFFTGDGTVPSTFDIEGDAFSGQADDALDLQLEGNTTGLIREDTVGDGSAGSGSSGGDGVEITNNSGVVAAELEADTIENVAVGYGLSALASDGGELDLTVKQNDIAPAGAGGATYDAGGGTGTSTLCLNTSGNTETAAASGATAESVAQTDANAVFELEGYEGSPTRDDEAESFLIGQENSLTGGPGGAQALASANSAGFTSATCSLPPGGGGETS